MLMPSLSPSSIPSERSSGKPSLTPSLVPSLTPSLVPSLSPSSNPSENPSGKPSLTPSLVPSLSPSSIPSENPSSFRKINVVAIINTTVLLIPPTNTTRRMLRRLADISDAFKDVLQSTIKALFSSVLSDSQTLTDIIIISANFTDTSPKVINLVFKIFVQELCELNCQNSSLGALVNNTIGDTIGNGAFAATLTNQTQAAINANASLSDDPILSQTRYLNSTTGAATLEIVITLTETTRAPTSVPTMIPSTDPTSTPTTQTPTSVPTEIPSNDPTSTPPTQTPTHGPNATV